MSFNDKERLEQREAEEDELYGIFYGYTDIQPVVVKVYTHLMALGLEERYKQVIQSVLDRHDRVPKLALILFAIWLCPELDLGKDAQPRRFEPFQRGIQRMCMDMLEGKMLSLQEFVGNTVTDYMVTPKG